MRIQRTKTMASKQPGKQAKSPAKVDPGEANTPARNRQRAPRRRTPQARSKSTATHTGSAAQEAAVALEGASEGIELSKNPTLSPQHQASQFEPISEGADSANDKAPSADRPLASTKRALLIGMLERPEGASVAEIGQRLGWLPHTVRAAITGLRHAGREVTRSKDAAANRCTGSRWPKLLPAGDGHGRPTKGCQQGGAIAPPQARHPRASRGVVPSLQGGCLTSSQPRVADSSGRIPNAGSGSGRSPPGAAASAAPDRHGAEANRSGCETLPPAAEARYPADTRMAGANLRGRGPR